MNTIGGLEGDVRARPLHLLYAFVVATSLVELFFTRNASGEPQPILIGSVCYKLSDLTEVIRQSAPTESFKQFWNKLKNEGRCFFVPPVAPTAQSRFIIEDANISEQEMKDSNGVSFHVVIVRGTLPDQGGRQAYSALQFY
jgi:hypothetical protein